MQERIFYTIVFPCPACTPPDQNWQHTLLTGLGLVPLCSACPCLGLAPSRVAAHLRESLFYVMFMNVEELILLLRCRNSEGGDCSRTFNPSSPLYALILIYPEVLEGLVLRPGLSTYSAGRCQTGQEAGQTCQKSWLQWSWANCMA